MMFISLQKHQNQDFIEPMVIMYSEDHQVTWRITYLCCILEVLQSNLYYSFHLGCKGTV